MSDEVLRRFGEQHVFRRPAPDAEPPPAAAPAPAPAVTDHAAAALAADLLRDPYRGYQRVMAADVTGSPSREELAALEAASPGLFGTLNMAARARVGPTASRIDPASWRAGAEPPPAAVAAPHVPSPEDVKTLRDLNDLSVSAFNAFADKYPAAFEKLSTEWPDVARRATADRLAREEDARRRKAGVLPAGFTQSGQLPPSPWRR